MSLMSAASLGSPAALEGTVAPLRAPSLPRSSVTPLAIAIHASQMARRAHEGRNRMTVGSKRGWEQSEPIITNVWEAAVAEGTLVGGANMRHSAADPRTPHEVRLGRDSGREDGTGSFCTDDIRR